MSRGPAVVRIAAILAGGAIALWIALGVTMDLTIAQRTPDVARAVWPAGVAAKAAGARGLLMTNAQPTTATIDEMRRTLRDAMLREPVNNEGLGLLASLDEYRGDHAGAGVLFRLAEGLSRRNTLVELWLIENAVSRGRVADAVRHYDRAMRVSVDVRGTLLPVLLSASSDPAILKNLLPVLAQRPSWWQDYATRLATDGKDPVVMAAVLGAMRINLRNPEERGLAENILRRMVALHDGRRAVVAANRLDGLPGATRSLRGGDFERSDTILPFAWWLRDETGLRAYRDRVPNGSMGLRVETDAGASGGVAQQLIGLAPGHYVFRGVAGDVPADATQRPTIELTCTNGARFGRFAPPASGDAGTPFRFSFEVPAADCPAQWVGIATAPAVDSNFWLDGLAITR